MLSPQRGGRQFPQVDENFPGRDKIFALAGLADGGLPGIGRNDGTEDVYKRQHYTLRVEAVSSDGVPASNKLDFDITIMPPWWAAWWAYLALSLIHL